MYEKFRTMSKIRVLVQAEIRDYLHKVEELEKL